MESKAELQAKIDKIDARIGELQAEIKSLEQQRFELRQEIEKIDSDERTAQYLSSIFEVTPENTQYADLSPTTRTTPIIDRFAKSDKRFLVFSRVFRLNFKSYTSYNGIPVSLVVAKSKPGIHFKSNGLVMTDLKKASGSYVSELSGHLANERSRLHPLYQELARVGQKRPAMGEIVPFENVCLIGGQTFDDQTDFGTIYFGPDVVLEGKKYGETTSFAIIGVIVEK